MKTVVEPSAMFLHRVAEFCKRADVREYASFYAKVYAALIIMAAYFSTIMTLLFRVRDHVLVWQKGVIKW